VRPSPTVALLTLSRAAELELARLLEPHGLTLRKFLILGRVSAVPGISTADLARRSGLAPDDVRPMLRALRDAGLTRAADERSATVAITPAGSRLLASLEGSISEIDERLFPGDRSDLAAALLGATAEPTAEPQD
jgi:DNA-binding MarR family transcriptional regulator